jgi:hypothetical protein
MNIAVFCLLQNGSYFKSYSRVLDGIVEGITAQRLFIMHVTDICLKYLCRILKAYEFLIGSLSLSSLELFTLKY